MNTQKLNINDIKFIIQESYNRLMLLEISNNAIETLFKKYYPDYRILMDYTIGELCTPGGFKLPDGKWASWWISNMDILTSDDRTAFANFKLKDYMRLKILKDFEINRGNGPIKYLRGIIRICCTDLDYFGEYDRSSLIAFKQIISYIYNNHVELDEDLNGLSFKDLYDGIGSEMRVHNYMNWSDEKEKHMSQNFVFGEYTVIPMYSFSDTSKYSRYTDWCVTQGNNHYQAYTSDGSQFYFCLKNGFEDVERVKGENCPLDEYGLSMVSVLVRPDNTVKHITTRWNHTYGGEDNLRLKTFEQVEEVLGIPSNVFKNHKRPSIELNDLTLLIKNGANIENLVNVLFESENGVKIISYNDNRFINVIKDNELLYEWYIFEEEFKDSDGNKSFLVYHPHNGASNVFDLYGRVFPEDIKTSAYNRITFQDIKRGIYKLPSGRVFNLLRRGSNEKLLSENIFNITIFYDGLAMVKTIQDTINFVDENYNQIWDNFENINASFNVNDRISKYTKVWHKGLLIVKNEEGKESYLDIRTKRFIVDAWFDECEDFNGNYGHIVNNGKQNLIKEDGSLFSSIWFDSITNIQGGYFPITINEKGSTFLNEEGKQIINKWWKKANHFNGNFGIVTNDKDKHEIINSEGETLFELEDKKATQIFKNGNIWLHNDNYSHFWIMNIKGEYLTPELEFKEFNRKKMCLIFTNENRTHYFLNVETGKLTKRKEKDDI